MVSDLTALEGCRLSGRQAGMAAIWEVFRERFEEPFQRGYRVAKWCAGIVCCLELKIIFGRMKRMIK